ncbi:MAG: CPBP family intramembrane metalloprotease [Bacteroidia bacterium]|nr:CPBP family intramembrane metalloprotease [Bacteroidia bacterium]
MKTIIQYIQQYFYEVDKKILALASALVAVFIFLNYHYNIDKNISLQHSFQYSFLSRYCIFLVAFALPYILYHLLKKREYTGKLLFLLLLLIAPAIFSLKIALDIPLHFSDNINWNEYWNNVFYWPLRLIIVSGMLFLLWKIFDSNQPFYGLVTKNIKWKPYWLMLVIMLPLIALASTQHDFLQMYPKLKLISGIYNETNLHWWHKLLFELSYGSDFISIELFFRGFLILAFIKWAGKDAILPMACFYCTIHFGKPLGECISSYFGGMILGIVVYNTRSILGGLMVHLGIAWLMEIGGYFGNTTPVP